MAGEKAPHKRLHAVGAFHRVRVPPLDELLHHRPASHTYERAVAAQPCGVHSEGVVCAGGLLGERAFPVQRFGTIQPLHRDEAVRRLVRELRMHAARYNRAGLAVLPDEALDSLPREQARNHRAPFAHVGNVGRSNPDRMPAGFGLMCSSESAVRLGGIPQCQDAVLLARGTCERRIPCMGDVGVLRLGDDEQHLRLVETREPVHARSRSCKDPRLAASRRTKRSHVQLAGQVALAEGCEHFAPHEDLLHLRGGRSRYHDQPASGVGPPQRQSSGQPVLPGRMAATHGDLCALPQRVRDLDLLWPGRAAQHFADEAYGIVPVAPVVVRTSAVALMLPDQVADIDEELAQRALAHALFRAFRSTSCSTSVGSPVRRHSRRASVSWRSWLVTCPAWCASRHSRRSDRTACASGAVSPPVATATTAASAHRCASSGWLRGPRFSISSRPLERRRRRFARVFNPPRRLAARAIALASGSGSWRRQYPDGRTRNERHGSPLRVSARQPAGGFPFPLFVPSTRASRAVVPLAVYREQRRSTAAALPGSTARLRLPL